MAALAATAVLLLLAALLPFARGSLRRIVLWTVLIAGVPTLGWLTLAWGPGMGVAGFALAALILCGHPRADRRPAAPPHGDPR